MTPDPTAFATLGALLVLRLRHGGWLLAIPVATCLVSGATLWAMASPEFWIAPPAAALAAVFAPSCQGATICACRRVIGAQIICEAQRLGSGPSL